MLAMPITSAIDAGSILVIDWKQAGLLRQSVFKPDFATFEQTLIQRKLGSLTDRDQTTLRKIIRDVLG